MWQPDGDTYRELREVAFGDPLIAFTIADLTIPTTDL